MSQRASFERRLRDALASPQLRQALDRAMPSLRERRVKAVAGKFEELRARATEARDRSVSNLAELVQRFVDTASAAGATVHLAVDASEARRIVGSICQAAGARLVVKSKSMATEEIELNPYLEATGIKVVETDLGEWIVQLAHETPSHFLAPAIHKTREQVAQLLGRETGETVPLDDIGAMVKVARKHLRQAFIDADVGISGANLAIAETGTVVIVTNEGNDRLVTTLPPVHIVIMGIEKIVETLDDAVAILRVLAPSATGQVQTSYVSFITGPSRTADIESELTIGVHGPSQVHIVLLDNGRNKAWSSPEMRAVLKCIRCSACVSVCPPYQVVGGHAFGYVYNGPVGLILTNLHHGLENAGGPQSLCAGCNACATVCPVSIPLPDLILDVRRQWVEHRGLAPSKRLAIWALASPSRLRSLSSVLAKLQRPLLGPSGMIQRLPLKGKLVEGRYLPALAPVPVSQLAVPDPSDNNAIERTLEGMTVGYFPGCITNFALTNIGTAAISLLKAMGAHVVLAAPDRCCGLPALNAGDFTTARRMAQELLSELADTPADVLVTTSASCFSCITLDYLKLIDQGNIGKLEAAKSRFQDMTRFLATYLKVTPDGKPVVSDIITYHDSCQSFNVLGLYCEARALLSDGLKADMVEMTESSRCCGFGGTFSLEHPEVAGYLLEDKIRCILSTGASVVATDNPGCIAHLQGGLRARGLPVKARHLVEVLADVLLKP